MKQKKQREAFSKRYSIEPFMIQMEFSFLETAKRHHHHQHHRQHKDVIVIVTSVR
jgi:hypothetical protein